ncbi:MAG: CIA30 family protein [Pseudomonadota bacterium]
MSHTGFSADKAPGDERTITDFTDGTDLQWYVLNDNVMGGRSDGDFAVQPNRLTFFGRTNTNGGGFSSIRTGPLSLDLSEYTGLRLRVMGDGRRYTWRLATDARWRGRQVSFWAEFDTQEGAWTTVELPFESFEAKFRGYQLEGPPPDPARIAGMGLMIYDKQDGPFEMRVESVEAYAAPAPFSLSAYQWKKRLLIISGGSADGTDVDTMVRQVAASRADFEDRDMALIAALDDGATLAEADRSLGADDASALRKALAVEAGAFAVLLVGKDGTVKHRADAAVPLSELYALIDTMPMRRREMD